MRREAAKRGLDPDKWFNNVEIVVAQKIGTETTTYVRNIYKYYVTYKLTLDAMEQQKKAREQVAPSTAERRVRSSREFTVWGTVVLRKSPAFAATKVVPARAGGSSMRKSALCRGGLAALALAVFAPHAHATEGGLGRSVTGVNAQSYAAIVPPESGFVWQFGAVYDDGDIGGSKPVPIGGAARARRTRVSHAAERHRALRLGYRARRMELRVGVRGAVQHLERQRGCFGRQSQRAPAR